MSVVAHTYTKLGTSMSKKLVNLETDALKVALLSSYTVTTSQDTAQFYSDVVTAGVGVETSGTGYTAGGLALTSISGSVSGHVYTLTCANPVWTTSTIAAAYALFYDSTPGSAGTNPVICYWDFGGTVSSTGASFTLTISGSGLLTLTGS
ncbi:hypothetical protein [Fodinicola feengrottensis]|uniref:Uncharacterized protein n=1 Tax=Fodinicola feengrottensis TaxID=435914 RepID=A0ABP4UAC4_9ACTN|nr:hypothetical protein [Fodinicola feengrottensis]